MHRALSVGALILLFIITSIAAPVVLALPVEEKEKPFVEKKISSIENSDMGLYKLIIKAIKEISSADTTPAADVMAMPGYVLREDAYNDPSIVYSSDTWEKLILANTSDAVRIGLLRWLNILKCTNNDRKNEPFVFGIKIDADLKFDNGVPSSIRSLSNELLQNLTIMFIGIQAKNDHFEVIKEVKKDEQEESKVAMPYTESYTLSEAKSQVQNIEAPDANYLYMVLVVPRDRDSALAMVRKMLVEDSNGELTLYLYKPTYSISIDSSSSTYKVDIDSLNDNIAKDGIRDTDIFDILKSNRNLRRLFESYMELLASGSLSNNMLAKSTLENMISDVLSGIKDEIKSYFKNQIEGSLVSNNENYTTELGDITVTMPSISIEDVSGLKFSRMLYPGLVVYVSTEITVKTGSISDDNSYFSFNVPENTFTGKSNGYVKAGSLRLTSKDTGNDAEKISYAKIMLVDRLVAYGQAIMAIASQSTSFTEGDGHTYTFKTPDLLETTDATPLSNLGIDMNSRIIGFTAPDGTSIQLLQPNQGTSNTWVVDNGEMATIAGLALVPDRNFYTVYDISGLTGSLGVLKDIIKAYRGISNGEPVPLGLIPSAITATGLSDSDIVGGGIGNERTVNLGSTSLFTYATRFKPKWLPLDNYESSSKSDKLLDIMLVTSSGETEITASKTVSAAQDYGYVYTMPSSYYTSSNGEVDVSIKVKNATSKEVVDTYSYTASITVESITQKILFRIVTIEEGDIDISVKHIHVHIDVHIGKADSVSQTVKEIKNNLPKLEGTARISFLPAYAPLWGTGVPTKIFSEVSYLASILEGGNGAAGSVSYGAAEFGYRFDSYLSEGTSTDWVNAALKYLVPTYIPIPAPESIGSHEIGLNRFAPGEYMGGYIVVDYSWPSEYTDALKATPAPKLITIIAEKVTVEFDGAQGVVTSESVDNKPHLIYKPGENKITMYTLGIGFGTPGTIGKRLYVLPSKAIIPEKVLNNPEKPGDGEAYNNIFDLIKEALKKTGTMGETLVSVGENMGSGGLYFQLTPYFGDRSNRWAYFMLTTGTYDRFVVGDNPGVHHVKVDAKLSAIHILVAKIPILGIPIPIPIPLAWEYDEDGSPDATTVSPDIYVSSIHPVILASYYDPVSSDEPFSKQLAEKGANYVAAAVWYDQGTSDEKEKYLGPVLLRGPYGYYYHYSESSSLSATPYTWWSSLGVALIDPDTGEAYSVEPVYDIGFSIKPLKITYSDMHKIKIDPEHGGKLYLQPVFIYGSSYVAAGSPVEIPVYRLVVRTASIQLSDGKVIHVALYGLEGRGKTRWQKRILNFIDDIKDKLSNLKSRIDDGKARFDEAMAEINNAFTRQTSDISNIVQNAWNGLYQAVGDTTDGLMRAIRNFIIAYLKYTATKIVEQIMLKITTKIISSVAAALAPDPTGGALSGIIQSIIEEALDQVLEAVKGFIDKTFGDTGIADGFLEKYGIFGIIVLVQSYVQEKVLKDIMYRYLQDYLLDPLKDYIITNIAHILNNIADVRSYLEQLKNGADEAYGMVDHAYKEIMNLIDQARNLIESIPYPVLFARAYAVLEDGEVEHAYGYIGRMSHGVFDTLLPIDSIEYPEGTRVLFITPYTLPVHIHVAAADTELDVEIPNININVKGSVIYAVSILKYLNTIGVLSNERYNNIADKLYSVSNSVEDVHRTVDPYAELLFLDPEQPLIVPAVLSS